MAALLLLVGVGLLVGLAGLAPLTAVLSPATALQPLPWLGLALLLWLLAG